MYNIVNYFAYFYEHACVFINFRNHDDYCELHYRMKIPLRVLVDRNSETHKYKYHVESPGTRNNSIKSLEFIVGPATSGGVIDRFLKVYCSDNRLKAECKWLI